MRNMAALAVIVAMMILGAAAPTLAQEGGDRPGGSGEAFGYPAGGEPPPPPSDYAYRDGAVLVSGDSAVGCREFVEDFDEGYDEYGDQAQAKRVIEQCKQAGLPSSPVPPEVRQEIRQDRQESRHAELSETGGASPFLAVGLLLTGIGLFALRRIG